MIDLLKYQVEQSIVVGGIRRKWPDNKRVDIVIQCDDDIKLFDINCSFASHDIKSIDIEPYKWSLSIDGVPVMIYIARNEQQFEVLKLVKTGDNNFIKLLSVKALQNSMVLKHSHIENLFGLYGLYKTYDRQTRKFTMVMNPMRVEAGTENEILKKLLIEPDDQKYFDPVNRTIVAVE